MTRLMRVERAKKCLRQCWKANVPNQSGVRARRRREGQVEEKTGRVAQTTQAPAHQADDAKERKRRERSQGVAGVRENGAEDKRRRAREAEAKGKRAQGHTNGHSMLNRIQCRNLCSWTISARLCESASRQIMMLREMDK